MAEQQQQPTPAPAEQQYSYTLAQPLPQSYDPNQQQSGAAYDQNQQQAAAAYDPSYAAYYASYYQHHQQYYDPNARSQQQPQQYYDYTQAHPHHQPVAPQIHSQQPDPAYHHYHPHYPEGHIGSRRGGGRRGGGRGRGRGRGGATPAAPAAAAAAPALKIWCEICRAECNSLEILEQHKGGKRHKKTAQKYEEMQKQQQLVAEYEASLTPSGAEEEKEKVSVAPEKVTGSETNSNSSVQVKRKAPKHVRTGKWAKKGEPAEPHRICTVCNVTSESEVAFNAHVAGKKHMAKLGKFQQHGAVFGPITVYVPPNQMIACPVNRPEPLYFGLSSYQMVGQVTYSLEDAPLVFAQQGNNEMGSSHDAPLVAELKDSVVVAEPPALEPVSQDKSKEADVADGTTACVKEDVP